MRVEVRARINPSEDPDKVKQAILNIFPEIELKRDDDYVSGESDDLDALENFKNRLGLHGIRDAARRQMKKGRSGNSMKFFLNKQGATVNRINFSDGDTPLGPIEVTIESDKIEEILDYVAPSQK